MVVQEREITDLLSGLFASQEVAAFMAHLYPPGAATHRAPKPSLFDDAATKRLKAEKLLGMMSQLKMATKQDFVAIAVPMLESYLQADSSPSRVGDVERVLTSLASNKQIGTRWGSAVVSEASDRAERLFLDIAHLKYPDKKASRSNLLRSNLFCYMRNEYNKPGHEYRLASHLSDAILSSPPLERTILLHRLLSEKNHPHGDIRYAAVFTLKEAILRDVFVKSIPSFIQLLLDVTRDAPTTPVVLEAMLALAAAIYKHPHLIEARTERALREQVAQHDDHSDVALMSALTLKRAKRKVNVDFGELVNRALRETLAGVTKGGIELKNRESAARLLEHARDDIATYVSDDTMREFIRLLRQPILGRPPKPITHMARSFVELLSDKTARIALELLNEIDKTRSPVLWLGDSITATAYLGILTEFDPASVTWTMVDSLLIALKTRDRILHRKAAWVFGLVLSQPRLMAFFGSAWNELGTQYISLKDGGNVTSSLPRFMDTFLRTQPEPASRVSISDVPVVQRTISLKDFLKEQGSAFPAEKRGHSDVYPVQGSDEIIVIKYLKPKQKPQDLVREVQTFHRVHERGLTFGNHLPQPITNDRNSVELLQIKDQFAVAYRVHRDYFTYLSNADLTDNVFQRGLKSAMRGIFGLARHGLYHTVPIRLFHNRQTSADHRVTGDCGQYTIAPDIAFSDVARGMGRLDDWPGSLLYCNYGALGWRDGEEVFTLDELMGPFAERVPQLRGLIDSTNAKSIFNALLLGNHLLAATLMIGNRVRHSADSGHDTTFWRNTNRLQPVAGALHDVFSEAYAALHAIDAQSARSTMGSRADWQRFARQVAFFMTRAHADFVKPGADVARFPISEIYGDGVAIKERFGPYRDGSFDEQVGYVGPDGDPTKLSLGPMNGPFPITEFEKAMYAVFIPPQFSTARVMKNRVAKEMLI